MSLLSKIFRRSNSEDVISEPQIDKSLFVDDSESNLFNQEAKQSLLDGLQNTDFYHEGFVHGYEDHSHDLMEMRINSIISEYQKALSEEIELLEKSSQEIGVFLTKAYEKFMPNEFLKLRSKSDALNLQKAEFSAEIELASDCKGVCSHSVNRYKEGYAKGLKAWLEEQNFNA